jgi:hypothetical protein
MVRMTRVTVQEALSFPMHCNTGEEDLHAARGSPSEKYGEMVRFWSVELADVIKALWGSVKEPILAEAIRPTWVYIHKEKRA